MITPRVKKADAEGYIKVSEGIWRKALVYGYKTLLTEFILVKGKILLCTDILRNKLVIWYMVIYF